MNRRAALRTCLAKRPAGSITSLSSPSSNRSAHSVAAAAAALGEWCQRMTSRSMAPRFRPPNVTAPPSVIAASARRRENSTVGTVSYSGVRQGVADGCTNVWPVRPHLVDDLGARPASTGLLEINYASRDTRRDTGQRAPWPQMPANSPGSSGAPAAPCACCVHRRRDCRRVQRGRSSRFRQRGHRPARLPHSLTRHVDGRLHR